MLRYTLALTLCLRNVTQFADNMARTPPGAVPPQTPPPSPAITRAIACNCQFGRQKLNSKHCPISYLHICGCILICRYLYILYIYICVCVALSYLLTTH